MMNDKQTPTHADDAHETAEIICGDGYRLHGHFLPRAAGTSAGLPVLISPATGVRQHFYLRFARWLAAQGHDVLVFDYRGIGLSLHGSLRDCKATLADWGQWCAAGGYARNAVKHQAHRDFHSQVRTPVTVLHAEDDDIATAGTVADLLSTLPSAPRQVRCLRPHEHGLRRIGHLDWFRQSHQVLWPLMAQAVRGEHITPDGRTQG